MSLPRFTLLVLGELALLVAGEALLDLALDLQLVLDLVDVKREPCEGGVELERLEELPGPRVADFFGVKTRRCEARSNAGRGYRN